MWFWFEFKAWSATSWAYTCMAEALEELAALVGSQAFAANKCLVSIVMGVPP